MKNYKKLIIFILLALLLTIALLLNMLDNNKPQEETTLYQQSDSTIEEPINPLPKEEDKIENKTQTLKSPISNNETSSKTKLSVTKKIQNHNNESMIIKTVHKSIEKPNTEVVLPVKNVEIPVEEKDVVIPVEYKTKATYKYVYTPTGFSK